MNNFKFYDIQDINYIDYFNRNGFVCIKNLYTSSEILNVEKDIREIFSRALNIKNDNDWLENFVKAYNDNRKTQWVRAATRMNTSMALQTLTTSGNIKNLLKNLNLKIPCLGSFPEVRTDMPKDKNYIQPWHQDWRYGQASLNSITVWTCLQDTPIEMGAPSFIKNSHKLGLMPVKEMQNPRRFIIKNFKEKIDLNQEYKGQLPKGASIIFNQLLVHGSNKNTSKFPRLSFQIRYADLDCKEFAKNGFKFPSGNKIDWEKLPF